MSPDQAEITVRSLRPAEALTPQDEKWLFGGLAAALPTLRMAELFALRGDMFKEAHLLTVAAEEAGGAAIGVLSSRWCALPSGPQFLHVLAQFVGDGYRNGVVFRLSWGSHLAALRRSSGEFPELLVLKTYNPVVYCAMRSFTRVPGVTIYPDITGPQDPAAARLARRVARSIAAGHPFLPETGTIRGIGIPRDLYPELPRSSDPLANDYFASVAEPGDRVLCMLSVPTTAAGDLIYGAFGIPPAAEAATATTAAKEAHRVGTDR